MGFLEIRGATKSFGRVQVLHETDIAVEEGEFLVLVGPSGCGKSTLLNMIAGLEEVTSGDIAIRGRSMSGVRPADRNIAMVFQSYALYPNMTVRGNIAFGLEMHGVPKAERERRIAEVAELLQIGPLLDRRPGQLSGGQRQRVAMGRALVRDPDVFLFDEPLSNLDAKLRVDMRTEIKKLHAKLGRTIIYVTHDQIEALTLSTRIVVMHGGHVQQVGTPKEVYDDPANMFVAGFMGSPSMNLFPPGWRWPTAWPWPRSGSPTGRAPGCPSRPGARAGAPRGARDRARRPARGDHRPRRGGPGLAGRARGRGAGGDHGARGLGHLRGDAVGRPRRDRAPARRRPRARGRAVPLRGQHGEGRGLRPRDREPGSPERWPGLLASRPTS